MAKHKIALIPGDGIGKEVLPEGVRVLEAAGRRFGFELEFTDFDWSCERVQQDRQDDAGRRPRPDPEAVDAIFLGAVGLPGVPDHVSLWGLLIPIRREFQQYINLRPVRLFEGVPCPLAGRKPGDIDYWVVRENNEGEYSSVGGRMFEGTDDEMAIQQAIFTRKRGCDRVMRMPSSWQHHDSATQVTSATKSNGIIHLDALSGTSASRRSRKEYPKVKTDQYHIDILTAHLVRNPHWFDVIVGSNLFGDILSDLGPAIDRARSPSRPAATSIRSASSPRCSSRCTARRRTSPGKGISNPIGQIWSGAMMLRHLGYPEAAEAIERAIAASLVEGGPRTKDLGGNGDTKTVGAAIEQLVKTA